MKEARTERDPQVAIEIRKLGRMLRRLSDEALHAAPVLEALDMLTHDKDGRNIAISVSNRADIDALRTKVEGAQMNPSGTIRGRRHAN
jgi:hypothetical protein